MSFDSEGLRPPEGAGQARAADIQTPRRGKTISKRKYEIIADELRGRILDGRLRPGARFPTLAEIQDEYGVAEGTAFRAAKTLFDEGLTETRPGAATRVRGRPEAIRLGRSWDLDAPSGSPWHAELAAQGRVQACEACSEPTIAPPDIAERLSIATGDAVVRTTYKYTAKHTAEHAMYTKPRFIATSWEPAGGSGSPAAPVPEDGPFGGWGIIRRLAHVGVTVTRAVEEVVPRALTGPEAEALGLRAGVPITVIERTHYAGEEPVETADLVIPPPYRPRYEIPVASVPPEEMGVG